MDGYVKLLFVQENTVTGNIIQRVTGGQWSHVAVILSIGLVEAMPPRVTISSLDRYKNLTTEELDVYVPDIDSAMIELKSLIGKPYGLLDCLSGGLHDVCGIQAPITGEKTIDCCELAVRVLRSGGTDPEPGISSDCFTPQSLYAAIKLFVTGA